MIKHMQINQLINQLKHRHGYMEQHDSYQRSGTGGHRWKKVKGLAKHINNIRDKFI